MTHSNETPCCIDPKHLHQPMERLERIGNEMAFIRGSFTRMDENDCTLSNTELTGLTSLLAGVLDTVDSVIGELEHLERELIRHAD